MSLLAGVDKKNSDIFFYLHKYGRRILVYKQYVFFLKKKLKIDTSAQTQGFLCSSWRL